MFVWLILVLSIDSSCIVHHLSLTFQFHVVLGHANSVLTANVYRQNRNRGETICPRNFSQGLLIFYPRQYFILLCSYFGCGGSWTFVVEMAFDFPKRMVDSLKNEIFSEISQTQFSSSRQVVSDLLTLLCERALMEYFKQLRPLIL